MQRYKVKTPSAPVPVLSTESKEQLESLRADFRKDIRPKDAIERMFCEDIVCLLWEINRWRRARNATLNLAVRDALYELLVEKLSELEPGQETAGYLDGWFTNQKVRQAVLAKLEKFGLDESSIEAEAFRRCSSDLLQLEQLLASAAVLRDKALHGIANYRRSLADLLRGKAAESLQPGNLLSFDQKK
jgi:hypothetical protein